VIAYWLHDGRGILVIALTVLVVRLIQKKKYYNDLNRCGEGEIFGKEEYHEIEQ
jgi:hypothetical protein